MASTRQNGCDRFDIETREIPARRQEDGFTIDDFRAVPYDRAKVTRVFSTAKNRFDFWHVLETNMND